MPEPDRATDAGLSNERTALAWQRTSLAIVAGAAVLGRLTIEKLGVVSIVLLGFAALVALWVVAESRWRLTQQHRPGRSGRRRSGRATLSLTVATCLIALTQILALTR